MYCCVSRWRSCFVDVLLCISVGVLACFLCVWWSFVLSRWIYCVVLVDAVAPHSFFLVDGLLCKSVGLILCLMGSDVFRLESCCFRWWVFVLFL